MGRLINSLRAVIMARPRWRRDDGLCICMFMAIRFIALGILLGAVLSFPAFALTAIACSIVYSFNNFSGTIIGCVADLLGTVIALQLGYFLTVITIVLSRCILLARRNDQ